MKVTGGRGKNGRRLQIKWANLLKAKPERSQLQVSFRLLPVQIISALVEHGAGDHGQSDEAETTPDTLHTAGVWGHVIQTESKLEREREGWEKYTKCLRLQPHWYQIIIQILSNNSHFKRFITRVPYQILSNNSHFKRFITRVHCQILVVEMYDTERNVAIWAKL